MSAAPAVSTLEDRPWFRHYPEGTPRQIGPEEVRWPHLPAFVAENVRRFGSHQAVAMCLANGMSAGYSYARLDELADAFAAYLRGTLKLEAGDRVAVQLPNCLAYPIVVFGTLKAGCVLVNLNPLYTAAEMEPLLRDSGARVLVGIDLFADRIEKVRPNTRVEHVVLTKLTEFFDFFSATIVDFTLRYVRRAVPRAPQLTATPFRRALEAGMAALAADRGLLERAQASLGHDTLAVLQFTGGTTGVSKAAMLSHGNLLYNVAQSMAPLKHMLIEGDEVVMTVLPLYHIFAFTCILMTYGHVGGTLLLIPNPNPISNLRKAFEKYKVTSLPGVNTLFNALNNEEWFRANPPRGLRMAIAGGTALKVAVGERWQEVTGVPIAEGYGLTETSPVATFQPPNLPPRLGTIGIPVPGTDVAIMDDDGNPVAVGERGEVCIRGPQVMMGYWQRPEETAKVMRDGWLLTGDIGTMDEDGYFRIVDRKKDMVLVSGFNVYPNEVEEVLARHPDVLEVAVIGVPHEETGEAVKAFVVPRRPDLTEAELIAHARASLTGYKVPKLIEFRDALPKSPVGKVLRRDLRPSAAAPAAPSAAPVKAA